MGGGWERPEVLVVKPIPECPHNLCLARIEAGAMGASGVEEPGT